MGNGITEGDPSLTLRMTAGDTFQTACGGQLKVNCAKHKRSCPVAPLKGRHTKGETKMQGITSTNGYDFTETNPYSNIRPGMIADNMPAVTPEELNKKPDSVEQISLEIDDIIDRSIKAKEDENK